MDPEFDSSLCRVHAYVPQALCSPGSIFPRPYVPQALYSPGPIFPRPYVPQTIMYQAGVLDMRGPLSPPPLPSTQWGGGDKTCSFQVIKSDYLRKSTFEAYNMES